MLILVLFTQNALRYNLLLAFGEVSSLLGIHIMQLNHTSVHFSQTETGFKVNQSLPFLDS